MCAENDACRVWCVIQSIFAGRPIRNHLEKYQASHTQLIDTLKDSLYADDFIVRSSSVEEAYTLTASAKKILSDASMNLCKWTLNSSELKAKWRQGDLTSPQILKQAAVC